ncbi:hypothetical protein F383_25374 [Gossypium arboreum]|uniref:Uncharacterized protein n=1 Tax=Gossypium arboreum TaxID=29729 RepID=A0A0B0MS75_GOSAR|nr:hypothetical protein F383_25374 [Gossypium arboreum]
MGIPLQNSPFSLTSFYFQSVSLTLSLSAYFSAESGTLPTR